MASAFGHAASIIGLKQLFPNKTFGKKALLIGIISAILPDIDVLAYKFGIMAPDILAHRGLTHSILFAFIWSAIILIIFHRKEKKHYFLLFLFYFLCTASHGMLDAMTTGGDGITFFLPFTSERYFLPWQVIQVSPIGLKDFFSNWGVEVLVSEFKYIGIPSLLLFGLGKFLNKSFYK